MYFNDKTNFEKLKLGAIFHHMKINNDEPEYQAINQYSPRTSRWGKIDEYISDIERIIREMDLCNSLIKNQPDELFLKQHNSSIEDYLLYHQGYFLELVHQTKDKIFLLINALVTPNNNYKEPDKIKIKTLLAHPKINGIPDIIDLISFWDQNKKSEISYVLNLRRYFHHLRNRLPSDENLVFFKFSKSITEENMIQMITEEGREMIREKGEKSFKEWSTGLNQKISNTTKLIKENIENLSQLLTKYFKLPISDDKVKKIVAIYTRRLQDNEYKNKTSLEIANREPIFKSMIEMIKTMICVPAGNNLISIYLTGSVARGEAVFNKSDVNLVVIVKKIDEVIEEMRNQLEFGMEAYGVRLYTDVKFITKEDFYLFDNFKTRFICKTDGFLLYGEDILKYERLPDPGLGLAYLLNKDFENKIYDLKEKYSKGEIDAQYKIDRYVKLLSKDFLRLQFATVMADYAIYTTDNKRMKELIDYKYPENWPATARTYRMATKNFSTDLNSLGVMIEYGGIEKYLPIIKSLEEKSNSWLTKWKKEHKIHFDE